jgi:hypothetical protein
VVPGHLEHRALVVAGRDPERVARSLHNQGRDRDRVQFGETARRRSRPRAPGRLQREGEAHNPDRVRKAGAATGNSSAQGATPDQKRQAAQLPLAQPRNHRHPGSVKPGGGCRRPSPGDPVRLLHHADTDTLSKRDLAQRHKVRRLHPSPRSMAKYQPSADGSGSTQVHPRRSGRRLYFEHSHPGMLTASIEETSGHYHQAEPNTRC